MKKLAIVGASGLVGQSVLEVLKETGLSKTFEIYLFGSSESSGNIIHFDDKDYVIRELNEDVLKIGFDYSIFLTIEDISRKWVEKFSQRGVVIDNSSAFRLNDKVPLVVPEINFNSIAKHNKIIANPNCSTIQLVIVLDRLRKIGQIDKVVLSSYQSVSGAGRGALNDLFIGTKKVFDCEIKNNFVARIGGLADNLNCSEENKIINETKKILGDEIDVCASTVRVPIPFCHGESVYVKFKDRVDLNEVKSILSCDYIKFSEDIFYPEDCVGSNYTYVCRLRKHSDNEFLFFIIADNLRRGASYNAVEILRRISV